MVTFQLFSWKNKSRGPFWQKSGMRASNLLVINLLTKGLDRYEQIEDKKRQFNRLLNDSNNVNRR